MDIVERHIIRDHAARHVDALNAAVKDGRLPKQYRYSLARKQWQDGIRGETRWYYVVVRREVAA